MARAEPKASVSLGDNDKALIEDMFMRRHIPDVMSELTVIKCAPNPLLPPVPEEVSAGEWQVYDGPLDDISQAFTEPEPDLSRNETPESEPHVEEGPPNWPESNTFETSDAVRRMR
jgi:hypothetical protein